MTHRLESGAKRNVGFDSLLWYEILRNEVGSYGKYSFASILPDKIARFLFKFHGKEFRTLDIPDMPVDRSRLDVHRMLDISQV